MPIENLDLSVCCIKQCDKEAYTLGLCTKHWRRNRLHGSPVAMRSRSGQFRYMSVEDRFWASVKKTDGCWNWSTGADNYGYGRIKAIIDGVKYNTAHRVSYVMHNGVHPGAMSVCHTCDNRRCVNPDHLFLGTTADNMADKIAKGRARVPVGEKSPHARITEAQAIAILGDARPYASIAHDYGIATTTVGSIKNRVSWSHLAVPVLKAPRPPPRLGVSDNFTPDDIRMIRASAEGGTAVAKRFGVSPATITDIRKRRSWAHVT